MNTYSVDTGENIMSYYDDENDDFDRAFIKEFADLVENELGIMSDDSEDSIELFNEDKDAQMLANIIEEVTGINPRQDVEFIYRDDFDELMENVAEHILYNSDKESLRLFDIAKERLEELYDDDEPYTYDDRFPDIRGY